MVGSRNVDVGELSHPRCKQGPLLPDQLCEPSFHLKAILRSLVSEYNRQNYPFEAVAGSGGSWRYGRTFPARALAGMDDRNGDAGERQQV